MRLVLSVVMSLALIGMVSADDKEKKVELKGDACCAKCELGKADKCATVIVVKKDNKEEVYYFDADSHKKHHGECCQGRKEATVKGTVTEKDGKKMVKVEKFEIKKKE